MKIRWRGLELPTKVECLDLTPTYGKFIAEPFERGFGVTIGNSLRRVLLSSLEGSAVTKMKLKGATLEFTSLHGVMEDVTDIVLNVKSLIVRSHEDRPCVIRIEKSKKGPVTGADIITDHNVDIINPDLVIATLTDDVQFSLEMVVEKGRGYVPATEHSGYRDRPEDVGHIPIDASFSPVIKVQYGVEETRVGQKTNYDRLVMQIWTDGSKDPEYALTEASKILRKHLNPFVQYNSAGGLIVDPSGVSPDSHFDPVLEEILGKSIADLKLSVRSSNCLETKGIRTVRELVMSNSDELLQIKNFGETSLKEVVEKLSELDPRVRLGMPLNQ